MAEYGLGVALGGGGARGFAHLGVINALREKGIEMEIFSGVSAGAIVAAYMAAGEDPLDVHQKIREKGLLNYSSIQIPKTGLLSLDGLAEDLKQQFGDTRIEDLPTPLIIAVTNLNKGEVEYLTEGSIRDAVLASASIPVLFEPVEMNGDLYVDGGLYDNLPIEPLKGQCDKVLGVSISPLQRDVELENMLQVALRVFQLSVNANTLDSRMECDILIEPEGLEGFDILNTDSANDIFRIGYDHVLSMDLASFDEENILDQLMDLFKPKEKRPEKQG